MCRAKQKHQKHESSDTIKNKVTSAYPCLNVNNANDDEWYNSDDADFFEAEEHIRTSLHVDKIINVPLHIISPITQIIWMWQCNSFRINMDFNFQRPNDWNDDTPIHNFNHSFYMQYHNVLDWHDFAIFNNNVMIFPNVIVDPHLHHAPLTQFYYYVTEIMYDIPDVIRAITNPKQLKKLDKFDWQAKCIVKYYIIRQGSDDQWILEDNVREIEVDEYTGWTICDHSIFAGKVVKQSNNTNTFVPISLAKPQLQHPDVASNKPFFFVILGCDKFHHTQFTGVHSMATHGFYYWFANFNHEFQFSRACTMTTTQAPAILNLTTIWPIVYSHWQELMENGCLLWTQEGLTQVYGMASHHIADLEDRCTIMRRRKSNAASRCDGMSYRGYVEGVKFPDNCNNLLQLYNITPGPYLLRVQKYLQMQFGNNQKDVNEVGKQISLTTCESDVFNELPIASSLKAPLEINHTTMLGLLETAFLIEWSKLHDTQKYDEISTRAAMAAYLTKYWHGINGVSSIVANDTRNWMKFNMINHSWQVMLEIMLCLPYVVNWEGNVNLLCNLVRMTGCLHTCVTENRRKELQSTMKIILEESLVFLFCRLIFVFFCFKIFFVKNFSQKIF